MQGLLDRRWLRSWNPELWATAACHPAWGGGQRPWGKESLRRDRAQCGTSPARETRPGLAWGAPPPPSALTLWGRAGGCRCPPRPAAGPAPHTGRRAASSGRRPGPPRSAPPAPAGRPHRRRCRRRSLRLPSWGGERSRGRPRPGPRPACGMGWEAGGSVQPTHVPGPCVPLGTWTLYRYSQPRPSALHVSPSCT